jgi:hypothetical protein
VATIVPKAIGLITTVLADVRTIGEHRPTAAATTIETTAVVADLSNGTAEPSSVAADPNMVGTTETATATIAAAVDTTSEKAEDHSSVAAIEAKVVSAADQIGADYSPILIRCKPVEGFR